MISSSPPLVITKAREKYPTANLLRDLIVRGKFRLFANSLLESSISETAAGIQLSIDESSGSTTELALFHSLNGKHTLRGNYQSLDITSDAKDFRILVKNPADSLNNPYPSLQVNKQFTSIDSDQIQLRNGNQTALLQTANDTIRLATNTTMDPGKILCFSSLPTGAIDSFTRNTSLLSNSFMGYLNPTTDPYLFIIENDSGAEPANLPSSSSEKRRIQFHVHGESCLEVKKGKVSTTVAETSLSNGSVIITSDKTSILSTNMEMPTGNFTLGSDLQQRNVLSSLLDSETRLTNISWKDVGHKGDMMKSATYIDQNVEITDALWVKDVEISGRLWLPGFQDDDVETILEDYGARIINISKNNNGNVTSVSSNFAVGTGFDVSLDNDNVKYSSASKTLTLDSTISLIIGSDKKNVNTAINTLDTTVVKKSGNQDIDGIKTFQKVPQLDATISLPITTDTQFTTKKYVDDADSLLVTKATEQTITAKKTFDVAPVLNSTINLTNSYQVTTKKYVDDADTLAVKKAGSDTITGVKTFDVLPVVGSAFKLEDITTDTQFIPKKFIDNIMTYLNTNAEDLYTITHNLKIDSNKNLYLGLTNVGTTLSNITTAITGISYIASPATTKIAQNLQIASDSGDLLSLRKATSPTTNNALNITYANTAGAVNTYSQLNDIIIYSGSTVNDEYKSGIVIGPYLNNSQKRGLRIGYNKLEVGPGIIETPSYEINASGVSTSLLTIKPNTYNGGLEVSTTGSVDLSTKNVRLSVTNSKVSLFGTGFEVNDTSSTVSRNPLKLYNKKAIQFYREPSGTGATITEEEGKGYASMNFDETNSLNVDLSTNAGFNYKLKAGSPAKTIFRTHACSGWSTTADYTPLLLKQTLTTTPFFKIYVSEDFAKGLNYRIPISAYRKGTIAINGSNPKYVITERINDIKLYYQEMQSNYTTPISSQILGCFGDNSNVLPYSVEVTIDVDNTKSGQAATYVYEQLIGTVSLVSGVDSGDSVGKYYVISINASFTNTLVTTPNTSATLTSITDGTDGSEWGFRFGVRTSDIQNASSNCTLSYVNLRKTLSQDPYNEGFRIVRSMYLAKSVAPDPGNYLLEAPNLAVDELAVSKSVYAMNGIFHTTLTAPNTSSFGNLGGTMYIRGDVRYMNVNERFNDNTFVQSYVSGAVMGWIHFPYHANSTFLWQVQNTANTASETLFSVNRNFFTSNVRMTAPGLNITTAGTAEFFNSANTNSSYIWQNGASLEINSTKVNSNTVTIKTKNSSGVESTPLTISSDSTSVTSTAFNATGTVNLNNGKLVVDSTGVSATDNVLLKTAKSLLLYGTTNDASKRGSINFDESLQTLTILADQPSSIINLKAKDASGNQKSTVSVSYSDVSCDGTVNIKGGNSLVLIGSTNNSAKKASISYDETTNGTLKVFADQTSSSISLSVKNSTTSYEAMKLSSSGIYCYPNVSIMGSQSLLLNGTSNSTTKQASINYSEAVNGTLTILANQTSSTIDLKVLNNVGTTQTALTLNSAGSACSTDMTMRDGKSLILYGAQNSASMYGVINYDDISNRRINIKANQNDSSILMITKDGSGLDKNVLTVSSTGITVAGTIQGTTVTCSSGGTFKDTLSVNNITFSGSVANNLTKLGSVSTLSTNKTLTFPLDEYYIVSNSNVALSITLPTIDIMYYGSITNICLLNTSSSVTIQYTGGFYDQNLDSITSISLTSTGFHRVKLVSTSNGWFIIDSMMNSKYLSAPSQISGNLFVTGYIKNKSIVPAYMITSSFSTHVIPCSMSSFSPSNSDKYYIVNPGFKIELFTGSNYNSNNVIITNSSNTPTATTLNTDDDNSMNSVRVYYLDSSSNWNQLTFSDIS